ncbi:MAG: carbohydrate binding family 9 domain-containing protein, partial [Myxococcota bacterium]
MNSYSPLTRSGQSRSDALRNSSLIHGLLLLSMLTLCGAAPPERKRIQAAPTGRNPLNIDGRLDEPAWQKAPIATDFIERTPQPGQPAAARTEFRVLYDENTVYVGLVMFTNGAPPRAWERARDGFGIFSDDAISLKFDVRLDARTTVGFATNPSGVQLDYISVENGGDFRREYDAIWDVSATVQPDRWTAEFAIPVIALGLPSGRDVRTIGLQVSRDDNARIATSDWA